MTLLSKSFVGYAEHIEMNSLDFKEFLWANGFTEEPVADIRDYFDKRERVPAAMHGNLAVVLCGFMM